MSQENVERAVAVYESYNRERNLAALLDWWHSDGEWVNTREEPDHATYRGVEAIRKLLESWVDAYPDLQIHPVERCAHGNRVFVWVRFSGHGAKSGAPVEMEFAHLITFEEGKIRRLEEYVDRAEALETVGLRE